MPKFQFGGALVVVIISSACGGSSRTPTTPTPPSPFANLVGKYVLTVEINDACSFIPASERIRHYDAIIDDGTFHFRQIRILGGGFTASTQMGELFSAGNSKFQLKWNEFDTGCDTPETLTDSRQLYLCGFGDMLVNDSTIDGAISGNAAIGGSGYCAGSHRFTFLRSAQ